jgi:protein-S-isoprenylcysteine O-methyltransferase Ste14
MLLMGALAWVITRYFPYFSIHLPLASLTAILVASTGLALNLYSKLIFDRAGTTVNPLKPQSTTHLVTSGIYRYTRNPMYLGQALILLGWTIYLHNILCVVAVPIFTFYISRFQIQPEERALAIHFPTEYVAFCKRSRRWL